MIYFTSDLHFFHDREFIWEPRGFSSEQEMRKAQVEEWNRVVSKEDDIYMLGDFCLGQDKEAVKELVSSLPGKIHIIIGNHDTAAKLEMYRKLPNVVEIAYATVLTYKKRRYYLSHYKTDTSNLESDPKTCVINLHGHIHSKQIFAEDKPYNINVSMDAQQGRIISIEEVREQFQRKVQECAAYLEEDSRENEGELLEL